MPKNSWFCRESSVPAFCNKFKVPEIWRGCPVELSLERDAIPEISGTRKPFSAQ